MLNRLSLLGLLLLSLFQTQVVADEKTAAMAAIGKIKSYYEGSIKMLSLNSVQFQDIEMACQGEVFLEWFYAYTQIIEITPDLRFSDISNYDSAAQMAHMVEVDRSVYDMMRPDLSPRILTEINMRRTDGRWSPGPGGLTLEDSKDQVLLQNLSACAAPEFVESIGSAYDFDLNNVSLEVAVTVPGYEPRRKEGEPATFVVPVVSGVPMEDTLYKQSYQQWLQNAKLR